MCVMNDELGDGDGGCEMGKILGTEDRTPPLAMQDVRQSDWN